jgi:hypothetical protein
MYLALKDDGLATIAEIIASYGISKNYLMKVAHQLGIAVRRESAAELAACDSQSHRSN